VNFGSGAPRWGDYGAAAVVGGDIWIASEYVAQTCTYAQYLLIPRVNAVVLVARWQLVHTHQQSDTVAAPLGGHHAEG